jgi:hypothetical protein
MCNQANSRSTPKVLLCVLVSLLSWKKIIKGIHITKIPNLSASV